MGVDPSYPSQCKRSKKVGVLLIYMRQLQLEGQVDNVVHCFTDQTRCRSHPFHIPTGRGRLLSALHIKSFTKFIRWDILMSIHKALKYTALNNMDRRSSRKPIPFCFFYLKLPNQRPYLCNGLKMFQPSLPLF